jgi:hypothetical protein
MGPCACVESNSFVTLLIVSDTSDLLSTYWLMRCESVNVAKRRRGKKK